MEPCGAKRAVDAVAGNRATGCRCCGPNCMNCIMRAAVRVLCATKSTPKPSIGYGNYGEEE